VQLRLGQTTESSCARTVVRRFRLGYRPTVPTGWNVQRSAEDPIEFVIGMHWHQLWRLAARPWVPLAFARMLRPSAGGGLRASWLRVTPAGPAIVQEWRDRDAVAAWSRNAGEAHLGPWRRFAQEADGTASWGIWHRVGPARR